MSFITERRIFRKIKIDLLTVRTVGKYIFIIIIRHALSPCKCAGSQAARSACKSASRLCRLSGGSDDSTVSASQSSAVWFVSPSFSSLFFSSVSKINNYFLISMNTLDIKIFQLIF